MSTFNYKFGWVKDKEDIRDLKYTPVFSENTTLPTTFSLETNMPEVLDQGQLGSCTANAICNAVRKLAIDEKIDTRARSRLFLYYNEREMEGNVSEDSGAQIRDGIRSVNDLGICYEETWPYDISQFATKPNTESYTEGLQHRSVKYQRVSQAEADIKHALFSGYPVIFGFTVYESIRNPSVGKSGIVPYPKKSESVLGGHAIILTGWNDKNRLFQFENSWGTSWGDKGYGYLPYKYVLDSNMCSDFWIIEYTK